MPALTAVESCPELAPSVAVLPLLLPPAVLVSVPFELPLFPVEPLLDEGEVEVEVEVPLDP